MRAYSTTLVALLLSACPRPIPDPGAPSHDSDTAAEDTDTGGGDTDITDTGPFDLDGDGHSASSDCDDDDASVHPDAEEACGDGIDADCDGVDPRCPLEGEIEAGDRWDAKFVGEEESYSGNRLRYLPDMDGDGDDELLVGDASQVVAGQGNGRLWLVHGGPDTGDYLLEDVAILGEDSDDEDLHPVLEVAAPGDLDGDGYGDLMWLSSYDTVSLRLGPFTEPFSDLTADRTWATGGYSAIAVPGDMTGNGEPDYASSNSLWYGHTDLKYRGIVKIFEGPLLDREDLKADIAGTWRGENCFAYAGETVAGAGDYDGDGLADLLIGAPFLSPEEGCPDEPSHAYVVLSPPGGVNDLSDADLRVEADGPYTGLGDAMAAAGDIDGDGYDDVVFGEHGHGRAAVFFGPDTGSFAVDDAPLLIVGEEDSMVGYDVAGGGDLDGDGLDELVVAGWGDWSGDYGTVAVFYGAVSGVLTIEEADLALQGTADHRVGVGWSAAINGDFDGDGLDDLAVGSPVPVAANDGRGATFVFFGAER